MEQHDAFTGRLFWNWSPAHQPSTRARRPAPTSPSTVTINHFLNASPQRKHAVECTRYLVREEAQQINKPQPAARSADARAPSARHASRFWRQFASSSDTSGKIFWAAANKGWTT